MAVERMEGRRRMAGRGRRRKRSPTPRGFAFTGYMYPPGFYKTDHRKLTLGEMVRWYGFWRLPVIYFATRKPPRPLGFWMPALWADLECQRNELSDRFWTATARQREDFERLGFKEIGFGKIKPSANLHPSARDDGRLTYLDATRSCIGMLFY